MIRRWDNFDLGGRNTFRMRVCCACYIEYDTVEDLRSIEPESLPQPLLCMGEGSNLLFTRDFPGTVLRSCINYMKYFDVGAHEVLLAAGSGVKWDALVAKTCADGLWGLENLSLIPGTVGAAAVQNIGAYGVEAKDVIAGVTCLDLQTRGKVAFKVGELRYGYRDSLFKDPSFKGRYVITGVLLRLSRVPRPRIGYGALKEVFGGCAPASPEAVRQEVIGIRRKKLPDPESIGSAGSFFKNPVVSALEFAQIASGYESVPHFLLDGGLVKIPAAWMIEQCGLKGARRGGGAVYENQPLVLINASGMATPEEILALEEEIIGAVRAKFGVELHPEVEHI